LIGDNSKLKIVILDEVDGVSDAFFKGLRASMDQFAKNTRFIATCNYINKIPEPIQSRFEVIDFNFTKIEETEIKKEYIKRILQICKAEGISIDKYAAVEIVKRKFPDLRSILNMLQGYKNEGLDEITVDNIKQHASVYKDVYDLIFDNSDPVKNYQYLVSNYSNKVDDILAALGTEFINYIITDKEEYQKFIPQISILVAKYQSQRNTVIDEVITLLACVYEIQTTIL
jgi:replication factor C small subunit